jgi:hypothetical protein
MICTKESAMMVLSPAAMIAEKPKPDETKGEEVVEPGWNQ